MLPELLSHAISQTRIPRAHVLTCPPPIARRMIAAVCEARHENLLQRLTRRITAASHPHRAVLCYCRISSSSPAATLFQLQLHTLWPAWRPGGDGTTGRRRQRTKQAGSNWLG